MEATLKFQLPEEQTEYERAIFAHRYALILWEMDNDLKHRCKHHDVEWACLAREYLHDICASYGVDLHEGPVVRIEAKEGE